MDTNRSQIDISSLANGFFHHLALVWKCMDAYSLCTQRILLHIHYFRWRSISPNNDDMDTSTTSRVSLPPCANNNHPPKSLKYLLSSIQSINSLHFGCESYFNRYFRQYRISFLLAYIRAYTSIYTFYYHATIIYFTIFQPISIYP